MKKKKKRDGVSRVNQSPSEFSQRNTMSEEYPYALVQIIRERTIHSKQAFPTHCMAPSEGSVEFYIDSVLVLKILLVEEQSKRSSNSCTMRRGQLLAWSMIDGWMALRQ